MHACVCVRVCVFVFCWELLTRLRTVCVSLLLHRLMANSWKVCRTVWVCLCVCVCVRVHNTPRLMSSRVCVCVCVCVFITPPDSQTLVWGCDEPDHDRP